MSRVALFGGTFDPVHDGHLAVALAARDTLDVEVIVVPAGDPYHKAPPMASAEHRLAMVERAFAGMKRVSVSRVAVDRTGPSYTIDTVEQLLGDVSERFVIVGTDQASKLTRWHRAAELAELVTFVVAPRSGDDACGPGLVLSVPPQVAGLSSTSIRAGLPEGHAEGVPVAVRSYIAAHGLYLPA